MKKIYALIMALFLMNGAMAQWAYINPNDSSGYDAVYFTDASNGFVTKGSTILETIDGGMNWIPRYNNYYDWPVTELFFPDVITGYAIQETSYQSCRILKTTNGGSDWILATNISEQLYSLFFTATDTGYAVGFSKTIFKTTDGGENWIKQYASDGWLSSVFFIDANIGYAVGGLNFYIGGSNRTILKTINGGLNWTTIMDEQGWVLNSVFFTSADTGYVTGGNDLLKTVDGGINWVNLSYWSDTVYFRSICFTDANTGYAVGFDVYSNNSIIVKTTDAGSNWFVQSINGTGSQSVLNSIFFPVTDIGYITSDRGILKTENGGGFPVGTNEQCKSATNLLVFPNPVSTTLTVDSPSKGSLSIHNTNNQQLLQQEITEPTTTIDVSGLKIGVYFLRVTDERTVQVAKFIKQ